MTETVKQRPAILVIDDDKQVRNLLRETLIGENEWVVASSAESKIRADSA
jgi:CheY-like chemotaxis protein